MEIRYKLTDSEMKTHKGFPWELGTLKKAEGRGLKLCSEDFLHCYTDPLLAVFLNPVHGNYSTPRMFKAEVKGNHKEDSGLKEGWKEMSLIEEIPLPEVSLTQRIAFGILCAKKVCKDKKWNNWADSWLSDEDRSKEEARAAEWAAEARAAEWAARAARAAEWAEAEEWAARAAARAAEWAEAAEGKVDLITIAKEAMKY